MNLLWSIIADTVADAKQRARPQNEPIGRVISELLGLAQVHVYTAGAPRQQCGADNTVGQINDGRVLRSIHLRP